jgi:hypothetical protein
MLIPMTFRIPTPIIAALTIMTFAVTKLSITAFSITTLSSA